MTERTCSVDGCADTAKARGLCWKHYKRLQRAGEIVRTPLVERIMRSVAESEAGCWEWTGPLCGGGYGRIVVGKTKHTVHRLLYELTVEPVPTGLELDHLCRNRACCNPAHLEPVTPMENWRRGESPTAENARKTTCLNGHPFADATWNGGRRYCPTCARDRTRRWRERNRS